MQDIWVKVASTQMHPRIKDWEEFKSKIIEFELSLGKPEAIDLSNGITDSLSGFINSLKARSNETTYPKYIRHLKTAKGRLFYSPIPFLVLCLVLIFNNGVEDFLAQLKKDTDGFVSAAVILSLVTFFVLSLLNISVQKVIPNWKSRKDLRLWLFASLYWIIGVLLFVVIFDPYHNGSWSYMSGGEWIHMFFVMFIPPIFLGSARYVYEKHIK